MAPGPIAAFSLLIAVATFVPIIRGSKVFDDGAGEGLKPFRFNLCASRL